MASDVRKGRDNRGSLCVYESRPILNKWMEGRKSLYFYATTAHGAINSQVFDSYASFLAEYENLTSCSQPYKAQEYGVTTVFKMNRKACRVSDMDMFHNHAIFNSQCHKAS